MKKTLQLLLATACYIYIAFPSMAEVAEDDFIIMENATVQIMNKAAGRTHTLTIPLNKKTRFDKMEITVRRCMGMNEFLPENYHMFIEVSKSGNRIFSGWMNRNEPGANPLSDADHDLWLVRCE